MTESKEGGAPVTHVLASSTRTRHGHWPWRVRVLVRRHEDRAWRISARVASLLPVAGVAFIVIVLALKAWPATTVNGVSFLTSSQWVPGNTYGAVVHTHGVAHPMGSSYGAWPLIAGTLETSVIALVIALPISLGTAFALTERLPRWVAQPITFFVEILAGIPSVIIGLWGVLQLGPFLASHVYPLVANHVPNVPVLRFFRGSTGYGEGLLTSGLILGLMIVPIIASTTRDLFMQVPPLPKEGAEALGMTDAEVARHVTIPWVRSGIIGATVLGLGRALGETIAVAMVSGSILGKLSPNIYGTMTTIAATIVSQLDSAATDGTGFAISTLAEAGLLLAVIAIVVNLAARTIVRHSASHAAPVGRV
ncbi:MAG: phosphate ABC transporter permease subunit PstC [Actinobacteria bacterium 21-64-8]|nr:MAG: phosphate ABC transporter permease subunit PstC [Actinobacteria bacterium 21-64-8]